MQKQHESLAEFVTRVMKEKRLSDRKVAARSGGKISHSTVADIRTGQRLNPSKDILAGLGSGLDVRTENLFRVAQGLSPDVPSAYEIYAERFDASELTSEEWRIMEDYFREHVNKWKELKAEHRKFIARESEKPRLAPVVTRIEPGKTELSKAEIQRTINAEIAPQTRPRKKKAYGS